MPPGACARQVSATEGGGPPRSRRRLAALLAAATLAAALLVPLVVLAPPAAAAAPARAGTVLTGAPHHAPIAHHEAGWLLGIVGALGAVALTEVGLGILLIGRRRTAGAER